MAKLTVDDLAQYYPSSGDEADTITREAAEDWDGAMESVSSSQDDSTASVIAKLLALSEKKT